MEQFERIRQQIQAIVQKAKGYLQELKIRHPRRYKWGRYVSWTFLALLLLPFLFYFSVWLGVFGALPDGDELRLIENPLASEIYAEDDKLLGKFFIENRSEVSFEELPGLLVDALIATEDARFYEHAGVDNRSLFRVAFKSVLLGDKSSGGGSTLSQQLAKNLFPRRNYGFLSMPVNKVREMIIAKRLEKVYSKQQILALYLNTVPFGESAFGIGSASLRFFDVPVRSLKVEEAATLVGMLKATTYFNPRVHPERALERRNVVLEQMAHYNILPQQATDSLKALPLTLNYHRYTPREGPAPYFQARLGIDLKQWLKAHPKADGSSYNLYSDGLKIYTSLDSRMQGHAKEALRSHMKTLQAAFYSHWGTRKPWGRENAVIERAVIHSPRYKALVQAGQAADSIKAIFARPVPMQVFSWEGEKDTLMSPLDSVMYYQYFLHAGFVCLDPATGFVKAWVGGIDYQNFQYDHVTSHRQVGSTFKPIVYAAALESGMDPCTYLANEQQTYEEYDDWSPGNADGEYGGYYSLAGGLTHSVNTISVSVLMETGIDPVVELAHKMGIKEALPAQPSIALGAADLSLLEMCTVYAAFANGGNRCEPEYLLRIEDRNGKVLFEADPPQRGERVLFEETASMMTYMLQAVVDSGTAASLRYRYRLPGDLAGKTGTTQSHADGWFIGFTPKLVAGAWVGAEDPRVHFRSLSLGQGAKTALPIWAIFMQELNKDPQLKMWADGSFEVPHDGIALALDCPPYQESLDGTEKLEEWLESLFKKDEEKQLERKEKKQKRKDRRKKKREEEEHGKFMKKLKGIFDK